MNNLYTENQEITVVVEVGLLDQFQTFRDVLRSAVHNGKKTLSQVAYELGLTQGKLSRMLAENEADTVRFPANLVAQLIEVTGDLRPIEWLAVKFLETPEQKRENALDRAAELLPQLGRVFADLQGARNARGN